MSSDSSGNGSPPNDATRNRRGSVTSAAFTNLFQRSNSTSTGTAVFPGPVTTAAMNDQRRRLSISTLGLSGSAPTAAATPFGMRRASLSTSNSDSIDESAIEEEEEPASSATRTAPTTPYTRRMSFGAQAMRNGRPNQGGLSPGSNNDQGFNWSEQLRSRAESSVAAGSRPSFSFASTFAGSPPRGPSVSGTAGGQTPSSASHERARSVSDMPVPPAQAPQARPPAQKPDHFQERILKGDFYMD